MLFALIFSLLNVPSLRDFNVFSWIWVSKYLLFERCNWCVSLCEEFIVLGDHFKLTESLYNGFLRYWGRKIQQKSFIVNIQEQHMIICQTGSFLSNKGIFPYFSRPENVLKSSLKEKLCVNCKVNPFFVPELVVLTKCLSVLNYFYCVHKCWVSLAHANCITKVKLLNITMQ